MSTKLKIAVVAILLLASAPTAFAQRAPGQGSATISHTSQDSARSRTCPAPSNDTIRFE